MKINQIIVAALTAMALSACNVPEDTKEVKEVAKAETPVSAMTDTDRQVIDLYVSRSKIAPTTYEELRAIRVLVEAVEGIRLDVCTTITGKAPEDEVYCERIRQSAGNLSKAFRDQRNAEALKAFK